MARNVVLIFGPPGAGKTTYAHTLGLTVYDRDDAQWHGDERLFVSEISKLACDSNAQAAVIRTGSTSASRAKAAGQCLPTQTVTMAVDPNTCIERVRARNRPFMKYQIDAIHKWWAEYNPSDSAGTALGRRSKEW